MCQGVGPSLDHVTAMSSAMAASALAGSATGGGPTFQQGSTHFTNCHFTHALPAYAGHPAPAHAGTSLSHGMPQPARFCEAAAISQPALSHADAQAGDSVSQPKPSGSPAQPVSRPQDTSSARASTVGLIASPVDQSGAGRAGADLEASNAPTRSLSYGQAHLEGEPHKQSSMCRTHGQVPKRRVRFKPTGTSAAAGTLRSCAQRELRTKEPHRAGHGHKIVNMHTARAAAKGKGLKRMDRMPSGGHEGQAAQTAEAQRRQPQPVFDYAHALAALNGQNTGFLQQLSCEGEAG